MNDTDIGKYGSELVAFFKARDEKKTAKKLLKEAQANYNKACTNLSEMRDNFNAVFDSSAEINEWNLNETIWYDDLKQYDDWL